MECERIAHKTELIHFPLQGKSDIALISETHLTNHANAEICDYKLYTCNHSIGIAQEAALVYIRTSL